MPNQAEQRVIDPILSRIALGYRHPEHIGQHLFPVVPVQVAGGKVIEFDKSGFRLYNTARAPGTKAKRLQFGHLGKPYAVENHALDAVVPREHQREAGAVPGIDLATRAVNLVLKSGSLVLENQHATLATDVANYDANHQVTLAGTDQWNDYANSNPIADVKAGREAIRSSIGMYPNVIMISAKVMSALEEHPAFVDRIKYTSSDSVDEALLARLFKIKKVVVGQAIAFDDDDTSIDLWGRDVVMAYVPEQLTGMEEPSYGYTYQMDGHPLIEVPFWDRDARSWIYGTTHERVGVHTGISAGFVIKDAVAP
jgi:hypothetical protein